MAPELIDPCFQQPDGGSDGVRVENRVYPCWNLEGKRQGIVAMSESLSSREGAMVVTGSAGGNSGESGRKPVIALVGALGAGKSTAARCLARWGGRVIDGDALGHEALQQPEIRAAVVQHFGPAIVRPDGSIDRRALGRIVFADPAQRYALERLVFPYIERRLREEIDQAQHDPASRFVVVDAAVLLEAGWQNEVDRIVYVEAPPAVRHARLQQRSGWTPEEIAAREASQWPAARKRAVAHAVLTNTGDPAELQRQVDLLVQHWHLVPDGQVCTGRDTSSC